MRFFNGAIHASLISTPDSVSSWNTGVIWVGLVLDTCLPGAQRDTTNRFCAKEEDVDLEFSYLCLAELPMGKIALPY